MDSNRYFSCLLIGQPGTGKTTMSLTAPKPILVLDVDNKLHKMVNAETRLRNNEVIQWAITDPLSTMPLSKLALIDPAQGAKISIQRPNGYIQLASMIDKLVETNCIIEHDKKSIKIKTVVLDSYTSINEHLKRLLMAVNGTSTMTLPLYGTALSNFETLNNTVLRLPANIIFTAHERIDKDELTGKISYRALIDGQMSEKIGKDFEEVYFLEKAVVGDVVRFEALTVGNNLKSCRTSRNMPPRIEPDFSKIYKEENQCPK